MEDRGGAAESEMDIEKRVMMVEHEVACVSHNTTSTQTCFFAQTALSARGTWVIHVNNYSNHHVVLFQAAANATTNAYLLQDKQRESDVEKTWWFTSSVDLSEEPPL